MNDFKYNSKHLTEDCVRKIVCPRYKASNCNGCSGYKTMGGNR